MQLNASSKALIGAVLVLIASFAFVSVVTDDSDADTLYSVTLNGNGGTSSDGSSKSYSVISGQGFVLPSNTFAKSGYILIGWSSTSTGAVQWHPGQEMTVSSNKTVYAVWQDLTYKGLIKIGGSSDNTTSEADVIQTTIGGSLGLDPSGTIYDMMKEAASQRTKIKYGLSVTYCGDAKLSETTNKNTSISADWLTLDISSKGELSFSGSPTRNGVYTIDVTVKTKGMVGGSYGDTDDLLMRWYVVVPVSADEQPTLVFDMDGGTGSVNSVKGPIGTAIVLPNYTDSNGTQIAKSGYTLVGWEIPDGRGSKSVYALGSLYTIAFDATVKAKWVSDPNVLVYSLDGGSLANVQAYVVHDGSSVTLKDSGVTKDGYTFIGWRPMQDQDIAYAPGLTIESNGSAYMQAYFVKNGTALFTVTYNANGGQGTVYSQQVESGIYVKLPTKLCMVREGYTFIGWSETQNGTNLGTEDYQVLGNKTLYAVWEQNTAPVDPDPEPQPVYYDVSFSTNQGQGDYPVQRILSGGYVVKPADPTRDGHVFVGWRSITESDDWNFTMDTVTSDTVLQARWEEHFTVSADGLKVTIELKGIYRDMRFDVDWGDIDGAQSEQIGPSIGKAEHTYGYTSYGYITVYSHDSSPNPYISKMPYSVAGEHYNPPLNYIVTFDPGNGGLFTEQIVDAGMTATEPEAPVWEGHTFTGWYFEGARWDFSKTVTRDMTLTGGWDDVVPDVPDKIVPKADFEITETESGWHLDASGSNNAVSYKWKLDGKVVGSGKTIDVDSEGLTEGKHSITLVVKSSTGHTDERTQTVTVPSEPVDPEPAPDSEDGKSWIQQNWWIVAVIVVLIAFMAVRFWI